MATLLSDRSWYRLLKMYRGATPVEIANAVARCAADFYCQLSPVERDLAEINPTITIEALVGQLEQFQMASVRDADELQAIRNTAYYARRASSVDTSRFAQSAQELFSYKPHVFDI